MTEPPNTSRSDACGRPIQCYSLASRKSVCRLATICSRPPKHNLKITRVPHGNPDATGPSADRLSALKSAMIGGVENPAIATKCFAAARASANPNSSALAPNATARTNSSYSLCPELVAVRAGAIAVGWKRTCFRVTNVAHRQCSRCLRTAIYHWGSSKLTPVAPPRRTGPVAFASARPPCGNRFVDLRFDGGHIETRTGLHRREIDQRFRCFGHDPLGEHESPELVGSQSVCQ